MNLTEISTRGTPTPDDLRIATAFVGEISTIAGLLSVSSADTTEFNAAMSGISHMLEIANNILSEGLDENFGTFGEKKRGKSDIA
jgi:hypothetical protein